MKLIVGLGNPGKKYKRNRHNVGQLVLDKLAQEFQITNFKLQNNNLKFEINKKLECYLVHANNYILAKPATMMNESGKVVSSLITYYKIHTSDLYVIHDDLDIMLGDFKLQKGKGPRDHKGLLSIYEKLGTKDFWHVRVGIDNRSKKFANRISGEKYVLRNFTDSELAIINKVIEGVTAKIVKMLLND